MTTSTPTSTSPVMNAPRSVQQALLEWWPLLLGFALLYVPTVMDFFATDGLWTTDDQAHGPIILVVVAYLLWDKSEVFLRPLGEQKTNSVLGALCIVIGLLMYILGRSQIINIFEIGSSIALMTGCILLTRGWQGFRTIWFAILFAIFMIPLPGGLVDAATGPLKQYISVISENVLYAVGYPIARTGVTIVIGQYQLLVADACSGLHSMFSLSALSFLYLYLMEYRNKLRAGIILLVILPIAFVANIIRVITLILVTYHFGDEAGQGFIHGSTGMLLFVVSLILLFAFDSILGKIGIFKDKPQDKPQNKASQGAAK